MWLLDHRALAARTWFQWEDCEEDSCRGLLAGCWPEGLCQKRYLICSCLGSLKALIISDFFVILAIVLWFSVSFVSNELPSWLHWPLERHLRSISKFWELCSAAALLATWWVHRQVRTARARLPKERDWWVKIGMRLPFFWDNQTNGCRVSIWKKRIHCGLRI